MEALNQVEQITHKTRSDFAVAFLDRDFNARVKFHLGGETPRMGWVDYGVEADDAYRACLVPTKANRALRSELEASNARRLQRKGYFSFTRTPDALEEADIKLVQSKKVALCVVSLFNRVAQTFVGGSRALFTLLVGDPRQDIPNLRLIVNRNLTSTEELIQLRARIQEEQKAAALVRANRKLLCDVLRARIQEEQKAAALVRANRKLLCDADREQVNQEQGW